MPLKAYIEVLQGFGRRTAHHRPLQSGRLQPRARQRLQVDRRARAWQPADPVRQRRRGNAVDGAVPRRHDRPGRPARQSARRHRPRREEGRQGPHRRDHGAPRHRSRIARAAAGALRLGTAPLRCRAGEGRAQGVAVQAGRHAGARQPLGRLPRVPAPVARSAGDQARNRRTRPNAARSARPSRSGSSPTRNMATREAGD